MESIWISAGILAGVLKKYAKFSSGVFDEIPERIRGGACDWIPVRIPEEISDKFSKISE